MFEEELQSAQSAAREAALYIRDEYDQFPFVENAPVNISTHVDRRSQELILRSLHQRFPQDGHCAEEKLETWQNTLTPNGRVWVVDPIDGTRGFAMKNGEFSVMIGLTIDNKPVVGVVLEPVSMRMTFASLGQGCWWQIDQGPAQRCQVTSTNDIRTGTLIQSRSSRPASSGDPVSILQPKSVLQMYSAGVKMAFVARGEADVYVNTYSNFSDWDICAGHILIEEAGGRVTGFHGETITYGEADCRQKVGMIASNDAMHDSVVEQLRASKLD